MVAPPPSAPAIAAKPPAGPVVARPPVSGVEVRPPAAAPGMVRPAVHGHGTGAQRFARRSHAGVVAVSAGAAQAASASARAIRPRVLLRSPLAAAASVCFDRAA